MATISKAVIVEAGLNLCQGDVFQNVRYSYINDEDDESVEIVEYTFPMAIIISQACDVNSMSEMISEKNGKTTKFMPSLLLCPIYGKDEAKDNKHINVAFSQLNISNMDAKDEKLFSSKEFDVVKNDWHYRFHSLTVSIEDTKVLENAVIDFKHYFCVPATYLHKHRKQRIFRLDSLFAEQITLKFATYLSRVAIP